MTITLKGRRGGAGIERRWTIVATNGEGPEIPTLAAEILAGRILAGQVIPGARHAWCELEPEDFEPLFARLAIQHDTVERALPPPLYQRLTGERFGDLPRLVQLIHGVSGNGGAAGEGAVERGRSPLARLLGGVMGMPPAGNYPLHVGFAERDGRETWTRDFGGHRFRSELSARKGLAEERFGPIRFAFALPSDRDGLRMELRRWSLFGVRLPRILAPRIDAREWQEGDRFRFAVAVSAPLAGRIVRYSGWLRPLDDAVPTAAERRAPEMPSNIVGSNGNGLAAE